MRTEFSPASREDLRAIGRHLRLSYRQFGQSPEEARSASNDRLRRIRRSADRIATAPHRGERHDHLVPGLRHLTLDDAVFYFVATDEAVRIVAIFWSGQDHHRIIADRIAALR